ncbi:MAG: HDOD domain-containing protein [Deltaproteobacteria bacterium]|nr:HDOD domain-containing protein [Deltaproteobacteria bacterium]
METADLLTTVSELPALPHVASRLFQLLNDPKSGAADVESTISTDPGLVANVLQLANSGFFARRRKITSIRDAVVLLGLKRVTDVAMCSMFAAVLPARLPAYGFRARDFHLHCLAVAAISEHVATARGQRQPAFLFSAALLHDIGKLALAAFFQKTQPDRIDGELIETTAGERTAFGLDHAEIGEAAIAQWKLPPSFAAVARWHHEPDQDPHNDYALLIDIVHVADALAHRFGFGSSGVQAQRDEPIADRLRPSEEQINQIAEETIDQIRELERILHD